jgi:PLP dependent protein
MGTLHANLDLIQQKIHRAADRAGRDPDSIELMAVTKTLEASAYQMAHAAGIGLFGENRVQEAIEKYPKVRDGYRLHLIGHLQRNKAKFVPGFFDCVESIDKLDTANALNRHCEAAGCSIDILLEFNTSGEESKSGLLCAEDLETTIRGILPLERLCLRGLMTIGPFTDDQDKIRSSFRALKTLFEKSRELADHPQYDTISMGMSSDFEIAIEEGATRIRVGSALFGGRN